MTEPLVYPPGYRTRRFQNWMLVGFLYSFFYMSRYSLAAIAPGLMDYFGWTKHEHLSIFETMMPWVYGLAVVVNGPVADRIGGRRAFLFGAAGVVAMNLLFGCFSFIVTSPARWSPDHAVVAQQAQLLFGLTPTRLAWVMSVAWAVNGYFQSFGALSIVKINAQWFHLSERGTFAAIFGVLIRFGLILAFWGCPLIVRHLPWRFAFWIPAGCVALLFVLVLLFVVEKPQDAGFPPPADLGANGGGQGASPGVSEVLRRIFTNPVMWTIALGSMMIGIVRRSIIDAWWPLYMNEVHHVQQVDTVCQVMSWGLAIAGILGGFSLGYMSDHVFHHRRAPVVVIGFVGMCGCLLFFLAADAAHLGPWGAAVSIISISFFINGAHGMIGGAASMDFGGRRGAATAAGLFDGMQYLAAAPIAGLLVPWVTKELGWQAWKYLTIPWAIVGAFVMRRIWNEIPRGHGGH